MAQRKARGRLWFFFAVVALALGVVLGLPTAAHAAYLGFSDVGERDWYVTEGYLDYVLDNELMTGLSATAFGPGQTVSRAQVATVLWRVAGRPSSDAQRFPDCDYSSNSFYADAVSWARETGVVTGYEDGNFGPADPVTREQLATMLARYAERAAGIDVSSATNLNGLFPDANQVSEFAREAMPWAYDRAILSGYHSDGRTLLMPVGGAQRDQMAKMVSVFHRDVLGQGTDGGPEFDDDEPTGAVLKEGVVEVDGRVTDVSQSGEELSVRVEGVSKDVRAADVVLLPACGAFPNGTALRVSSVSPASFVASSNDPAKTALWILGSPVTAIDEVFSSIHINEEFDLNDLVTGSMSVSAAGISLSTSPREIKVGANLSPGDGVTLSGSFAISDFYARVRIDTRDGDGALPVLDTQSFADIDLRGTITPSFTLKVSALPDALKRIEVLSIPIPCAGIPCLGLNFNLYVTVDVTGEVGLTTDIDFTGELDKGYDDSKPSATATASCRGLEQSLAITGKVGVQPTLAIELLAPVVDLGVEGGAQARFEHTEHPGLICGDGSAWFYSNVFVRALGGFLGDDLRATLDVFTEGNSPLKTPPYHVENGVRVPACTWEEEARGWEWSEYDGATFGFVSQGGMYYGLTISRNGDTYQCYLGEWHDLTAASVADFSFGLVDGETSYVATEARSGKGRYRITFSREGDGPELDVSVEALSPGGYYTEGTYYFWPASNDENGLEKDLSAYLGSNTYWLVSHFPDMQEEPTGYFNGTVRVGSLSSLNPTFAPEVYGISLLGESWHTIKGIYVGMDAELAEGYGHLAGTKTYDDDWYMGFTLPNGALLGFDIEDDRVSRVSVSSPEVSW